MFYFDETCCFDYDHSPHTFEYHPGACTIVYRYNCLLDNCLLDIMYIISHLEH